MVTRATISWILLIFLSSLGGWAGGLPSSGLSFAAMMVVILVIKGQLIVDNFMGLRQVSLLWRSLLSAYCVVIGAFILLAYSIA